MTKLQETHTPSVHELRSRWKPHKERLQKVERNHPTTVRFHRACSWLARVEAIEDAADVDFVLLAQWIAFNSLYGQWDEDRREPLPDGESTRRFLDRILALDADDRIAGLLTLHRPLVERLLEDEYLSGFYWRDPTPAQARKAKKPKYDAATWYLENNWTMLLDRALERVYLLRCQLVHGAATFGSKLNRDSLRRCSALLGHLVPGVMLVLIDHGADTDWGTMCYPPQRPGRG